MTQREFFKLLAETPRRWVITDNRDIRCAKGDCPIMAVYRKAKRRSLSADQYQLAAARLGIDAYWALSIVYAADDIGSQDLRKRLLRACGVK